MLDTDFLPVAHHDTGRLRDGTLVRIRAVGLEDQDSVRAFVRNLSREALDLRFFGAVRPEMAASEILAPAGSTGRVSLVLEAIDGSPGSILAHGEYIRHPTDARRAEVAFLVADDRRGQGAATLLLHDLAHRARGEGIVRFDAVTRVGNGAMLEVFLGSGFPCSLTAREDLEYVTLDIGREPRFVPGALGPVGNRPQYRA
jgi:GNAT superfamily N-acetyltransferase